jgi:hypothetical protein
MQKFIISVKEKYSGRDVVAPYIVNSLDGLGNYSERLSPMGLIVKWKLSCSKSSKKYIRSRFIDQLH